MIPVIYAVSLNPKSVPINKIHIQPVNTAKQSHPAEQ